LISKSLRRIRHYTSAKCALQFAAEGAVEDRGKKGNELGGGFGLEALEGVHFGLQGIELGS